MRMAMICGCALAAQTALWSASDEQIAPGDYWLQPPACLTHSVRVPKAPSEEIVEVGPIIWCVQRMEVGKDRMTMHVSRVLRPESIFKPEASYGLKYVPDHGNRKMYLLDNNGKRYDSLATTGSFHDGGAFDWAHPFIGTFVFSAPSSNARSFVFHDDDLGLRLEGARPDARNRVDPKRQEAFRAVLKSADRITYESLEQLGQDQITMTFSLKKQPSKQWAGEALYVGLHAPVPMPVEATSTIVARFLHDVGRTPLIEGEPPERVAESDGYSQLFEIAAGKRTVRLETWRTGMDDDRPWTVTIDGKTYTSGTVSYTDEPVRELIRELEIYHRIPLCGACGEAGR